MSEIPDIEYEIWQTDMLVASSNSLKEAVKYAIQYAEDGLVELYKVTREPVNIQRLIEESTK